VTDSTVRKWSEWQDLNLLPPILEREVMAPAEFASASASELLNTRQYEAVTALGADQVVKPLRREIFCRILRPVDFRTHISSTGAIQLWQVRH
jgi:hypothetical protein